MKKLNLLLGASLLMLTGAVSAQTCTSTSTLSPPPSSVNVAGNTCSASNTLSNSCGSSTPIGAAFDLAYQVTLSAGNNFTISVAPTGWDAYVALLSGSCSEAAACPSNGEADNGGVGTAETLTLSNLGAGTYFVLVSSLASPGGNPETSCGPFALTATGAFPVSLENFSID